MSGAPAWLSYGALALSAGSLAVATLAYRAGGPRLRIRAEDYRGPVDDDPFVDGATFELTVVNAGRAAVSVEEFHLTPYGERRPAVRLHEVEGETLPLGLEAHASQTWQVNALPAARDYDSQIRAGTLDPHSSWPSQFRFSLTGGNGRGARTAATFDSLRIIADSRGGA